MKRYGDVDDRVAASGQIELIRENTGGEAKVVSRCRRGWHFSGAKHPDDVASIEWHGTERNGTWNRNNDTVIHVHRVAIEGNAVDWGKSAGCIQELPGWIHLEWPDREIQSRLAALIAEVAKPIPSEKKRWFRFAHGIGRYRQLEGRRSPGGRWNGQIAFSVGSFRRRICPWDELPAGFDERLDRKLSFAGFESALSVEQSFARVAAHADYSPVRLPVREEPRVVTGLIIASYVGEEFSFWWWPR